MKQTSFFNSPESFFVRDGIDFIGSTGMESLEHISNVCLVHYFESVIQCGVEVAEEGKNSGGRVLGVGVG